MCRLLYGRTITIYRSAFIPHMSRLGKEYGTPCRCLWFKVDELKQFLFGTCLELVVDNYYYWAPNDFLTNFRKTKIPLTLSTKSAQAFLPMTIIFQSVSPSSIMARVPRTFTYTEQIVGRNSNLQLIKHASTFCVPFCEVN